MFGEGQVLSSMGGNGVPPETLFSSPTQNLSFNFMANNNLPFNIFPPMIPEENGVTRSKEEMESGSGSEHFEGGISGNEQEADEQQQGPPNKKKRYHRHTASQIQEMESLFKENPHPDDKQRMKLSQDLGLKPRQVKFWFQNRRTQMKAQQDRADNAVLRAENENVKNENYRLQAALRNVSCPNCGGPAMLGEMGFDEQQIRLENARLKDELGYMCSLVAQYSGRPIQSILPPSFLNTSLDMGMGLLPRKFEEQTPVPNCANETMIPLPFMPENPNNYPAGSLILEEEKSLARELALSSMDELVKMCQMGEPLWLKVDDQSGRQMLNIDEYSRMFPCPQLNMKQPIRTEATRHTAVVIMNSITLVDAFLDANKWMELFPSIISRAKTLQVIASGASGHASGSLFLMYAELQVLSPFVPTRETHFLRYCQQNVEEGTWIIVDFPLGNFHTSYPLSYPYYKRRPSGCVIQDMPNGYSRITWVEHAVVEDYPVHQILDQFVSSGIAFGAQRWLDVLQQQCERFASLMARNVSDLGVIPSLEARRNLMCLAQRMVRSFCVNISTAYGQCWTSISDPADNNSIRITTRKVTEPGQINGLILTGVLTIWLPYPHYQVFDLLRDEHRRAQLDVLSNGNTLQEVAHIANGSHPGNCISILRMNVANNSSQRVELMLQESSTDESGSLVVYTTVNVEAIQEAMTGQDPSCIPLLPLGFVIVPMNHPANSNASGEGQSSGKTPVAEPGCLLSVGLQVLTSTLPTAKLNLSSVNAITHHLCSTAEQINAALTSSININGNCDNATDIGATLASPTEAAAVSAVVKQGSPE
ncbi:homeodomain transcription factor [Lithospermum erythrorhizon]|uniref:Homeodomain transcription factor n=1 Tax=Lithospermum erythrorhizon TaxID=34254 RepID=A0AAV3NV61_LITER